MEREWGGGIQPPHGSFFPQFPTNVRPGEVHGGQLIMYHAVALTMLFIRCMDLEGDWDSW